MNIKQPNTDMRNAYHAKGIKGRGIVFAVVDTGTAPAGMTNIESGNFMGTIPDNPHGTMVASVIREWCPDAKIITYNAVPDGAACNDALADVVKRVKADKANRYIVNLSFSGGGSQYTDRLHDLIRELVALNVPVFCSAGNNGTDALGKYPATWKEPICIAALNADGTPAGFSNWTGEVDFADDGVEVDVLDMTGAKTKASGTSFSTPTVAGKVGLLLCERPTLTELELFSVMKSAAIDMYTTGFDPNTGWGFVQIKPVQAPVTSDKPTAPVSPAAPTRRVLRLTDPYMRGDDVREAQARLGIKADGVFGKYTDAAVRAFQAANGLTVDGVIGSQTWAALDKAPETGIPISDRINHFIAYLKGEVANGSIYVWGAQGEKEITEGWIQRRETSKANAARAIALWHKRLAAGYKNIRAFDCSGLIVYYLNREGLYKYDMSANGLYGKSVKLKREELRPGDLVFRHNGLKAYHVGVYVGDGKVIEAKGRDDGVVMRDINASGTGYWNRYGRLGVISA